LDREIPTGCYDWKFNFDLLRAVKNTQKHA
jgi:hypothetical protein